MKNQSKKKAVIRPKQMIAAQGQAVPTLQGKIPEVKPPLESLGRGYLAAKILGPVSFIPELRTGEHVATSGPEFSPPTLVKSVVDIDSSEDVMVFRFQET